MVASPKHTSLIEVIVTTGIGHIANAFSAVSLSQYVDLDTSCKIYGELAAASVDTSTDIVPLPVVVPIPSTLVPFTV